MLLNKLNSLVKKEREWEVNTLPPNFIKNILDEQDSIPERGRVGNYNGYVHVSSLSGNFCAREYAIAHHEGLAMYETHTGGHKITFKIGRAVEEHIRTNIINKVGRKNIFAKWGCECGETSRIGLFKEALCKCGKPLDNFDEPAITDEVNGVVGRPDLVLYHNKTLHITEIKSMKKETTSFGVGWNELSEPLDSHIKQNIFYPPLLRSLDLPVSPVVTFIYCTKDFKWGSPYKEFRIDTSESKYEKLREELLVEAKSVREFVKTQKSPERICLSEASPLAKKCKVAFRCFNVYRDEIK
jgi:hypothetical protein